MSISFPFHTKTIEEGDIPNPVATLTIKTNFGEQNLDFLVDSGADTTTLPLAWAELFNFTPNDEEKTWIGGVEGGRIAAYPASIEIAFDKKFYTVRCVFVTSDTMPLLGRVDVWGNFSILFDNQKQQTTFEPLISNTTVNNQKVLKNK